MSERNEILDLAKKNFLPDEPSPFDNLWYNIAEKRTHRKVQKWLKNKINANTLILNAGSGGTDYKIKTGTMVHLDIVDKSVNMYEQFLIASIDCIPCENDSFDVVICIGSVLNYADVILSIKELSRVLKPSGILILEFERSNSAEFIFTNKQNKNVILCDEKYGKQRHKYWVYDEKFVCNILKNNGMKIKKKTRFHILSALVLRFINSEDKAARFAFLDFCFPFLSYYLANNVIFYLTKRE